MTAIEARKLRHPEKRNRPDNITPRKPHWIRVKAPNSATYFETKDLLRSKNLNTVCEEAGCPNIAECWAKKHATFMILGNVCTRACSFCNVATGKPKSIDQNEPERLSEAVAALNLSHVVITSVDRDDLLDGGAEHFSRVITELRRRVKDMTVEVLTPDFMQKPGAAEIIAAARPDVFNHNIETVPRLYPSIRPGSRYFVSLALLHKVKELDKNIFTKSGMMVGLGETRSEIYQVMDDLRAASVDFLTIGQYLQPTPKHSAIQRFVTPKEFDSYARMARGKGFLMVSASPMTRSSYHADEDFRNLCNARDSRNTTE